MTKTKANIAIIDDDKDVLLAARLLLKNHFSVVKTAEDPRQILTLMESETYDVILLDMNFTKDATSGQEGFYWLKKILKTDPLAVVILITAYGDVQTAVQTIKKGATDFILKPWENERLIATTSTALKLRKSKTRVDQLQHRQRQLSEDLDSQFHQMIGTCPGMRKVFSIIEKVGKTDVNVLITGENGTGKELVARALHRQSLRADNVFISVDMGAISETLFESELFGHVKGSFTDARDNRTGRFEIASGGTLFLDEISNLSLPLQAKLLRVLEERQVIPVGSNKPKPVDIRLLCATNSPIYKMTTENKFRQDLLYRVNTVEIQLPPLRERGEDIKLLAQHFITDYAKKYRKPVHKISATALNKLKQYHWPGNIRELKHTIERSVIMSENHILQDNEFLFPDTSIKKSMFKNFNLSHVEKVVIKSVLRKQGGNISQAAKELGLTRAALYRRMSKHDL
ncbi:MAG: sigma-54-dependent Fis family transcriptional regulator [Desulfobacteraceae bacterium]|nr:sigma-54-dependent Fis family transcriptional regulator [Desulfobacteraceae bacterium]